MPSLLEYVPARQLDNNGNPVAGTRLHTWVAGTTTNLATYTDPTLSTPLPNPIIADSQGFFPQIWLLDTKYDLEARAADDATVLWSRGDIGTLGTPLYFVGGFGSDDGPGFVAMANANPYRKIVNYLGNTLNFYGAYTVTADGVELDGNGGTIKQHVVNVTSLTMAPTTAGTTAAYSNFMKVTNFAFDHSAVAAGSTKGIGLQFVQCNSYDAVGIKTYDCEVVLKGGQYGRIDRISVFASSGATRGSGTALIHVQDAPVGAGWQMPFTLAINNWKAAGSKLRDAIFRIHSGDGITIGEGYGGGGVNAIVLVLGDGHGGYAGPVAITSKSYLDCVSPTTGTVNGVEIRDDGDPSFKVYNVSIDATIGNGQGVGVLCRKPETYAISIGGVIENFTSWAIDHSGGSTADINISDLQLPTNGTNGVSGDIRLDGGNSLTISNVTHRNSKNVCALITGTWRAGAISGCVNSTGVAADFSIGGATFINPLQRAGNSTTYFGAPANTWSGAAMSLFSYANNAAAITAGLQVGSLYRVGNVVQIV